MNIDFKNGIYYLSGRLDEYAEFESLVSAPEPLKLNFGKLQSINSIGIRKFLAFVIARAGKKFEFYECTPDFITNVNVIPQMLGTPSDSSQVKSFYVPFSCESCKRIETLLIQTDKLSASAPDFGELRCSKCGEEMDLDIEKSEYLLWFTE